MNTTITFAGNLTADPSLAFTPNGKPVAEFRVLVNRRTRNAEGDWTDAEPTGLSCKLWGKGAENLTDSLTKGDRVLVHGRVETEAWTDKDGQRRSREIVLVDEVGTSLTFAAATPTPTRLDNPGPGGWPHLHKDRTRSSAVIDFP